MELRILWYIVMFSCAALFYGIGIYAQKRKAPMWFWSGTEVKPSAITDVARYNLENGRMWKTYSLWFWISGIAIGFSVGIALAILFLAATLGSALLIRRYLKIQKTYTQA